MPSFKAVIFPFQMRKNNTYNVKIRIQHKCKKSYFATPYYISKRDLNADYSIKNRRILDECEKIIVQWKNQCMALGGAIDMMTAEKLLEWLKVSTTSEYKPAGLDFIEFARGEVKKMEREGKHGNAEAYGIAVESFANLVHGYIDAKQITPILLQKWHNAIKEHARARGYQGDRAAEQYMIRLRAIYNRALKMYNVDGPNNMKLPTNLFAYIDKPAYSLGARIPGRVLSGDELRLIASTPSSVGWSKGNTDFNLARRCFMLSFMLLGTNPVDLYECKPAVDGRVSYERTKTKNRRADNAFISIDIPDEARELMAACADPTGKRAFRFYLDYKNYKSFYNAVNRGVKLMRERLSIPGLVFYSARHSWATIAVNDAGVNKYVVHEALNHVDPSLKITNLYIRPDFTAINIANRAVLDLLQLKLEL